ncbi:zinc finger CCCH domain-containing protein 37 isoform X2 [Impatiens glandulifera]|uniref:zinc finger CCCH domain-containing protein 37 isoform X2 n=1 Tax=Impatiens glandulifera TaxID=253017 RepID=UPI001FB15215|nr:zinc finger CCCH domain-containing protein 37 isoform X2 [Impatiens glandulifera]
MLFNRSDALGYSSKAGALGSRVSGAGSAIGIGAAYGSPTSSHLNAHGSWAGLNVGASDIDPLTVLYHQSLAAHNTIGHDEAWYSTNSLTKRPRFLSSSNLPIYPQRPGEKDCAFYMQTRTCKFGDSCKFDHPIWVPDGGIPDWKEVPPITESLPERPGEPDCPYFLKTQRCKFGFRCKFNHPNTSAISVLPESNAVYSLPERPSEPPCAFYMKTGKCKFGATCKFHHPKDVQIPFYVEMDGVNDVPAGSLLSPALLHNSKGLPVRMGEVDCPFYLKTGSCKYGATCRYNHPDRAISHSAISPAFTASHAAHFNLGVVNPAASILQTIDPRLTQTMLGLTPTTIYPQRPGQLECDFYMKTGVCKFGERCRFNHPMDRTAPTIQDAIQQNVKITPAGLPRREGSIHCPYYMKTGTCKYGVTCKFDHPPPGELVTMATSSQEALASEDP